MTKPTYRAGWRYVRGADAPPGFAMIHIRRGGWMMVMTPEMFDDIDDEYFANLVAVRYRETVFEQLQADLDVLVRQLQDEIKFAGGLLAMGTPVDDVLDVLKRREAAKADTPEITLLAQDGSL